MGTYTQEEAMQDFHSLCFPMNGSRTVNCLVSPKGCCLFRCKCSVPGSHVSLLFAVAAPPEAKHISPLEWERRDWNSIGSFTPLLVACLLFSCVILFIYFCLRAATISVLLLLSSGWEVHACCGDEEHEIGGSPLRKVRWMPQIANKSNILNHNSVSPGGTREVVSLFPCNISQ